MFLVQGLNRKASGCGRKRGKRVNRLGVVLLWLTVCLAWVGDASAESSRGVRSGRKSASGNLPQQTPGHLRICTQNLARLGGPIRSQHWKTALRQREALISRFVEARCDVIAVQEVFGESKEDGERLLQGLAQDLTAARRTPFQSFVGSNESDQIRNGFLVSTQSGKVLEREEYWGENLPRLSPLGRPSRFTRAPLALLFEVTAEDNSKLRVLLVNVHFKSKSGGWKDPTGTDYETVRMEMAEGVRTWVTKLEARLGEETIVVILGDRNSTAGSASVEILSGLRHLSQFGSGGGCRLDPVLEPECDGVGYTKQEFVGLLELKNKALQNAHDRKPFRITEGTYRYRGELSILDDIMVESSDVELFSDGRHVPEVGTVGVFNEGSDHKLVYVDLER